MNFQSHATLTGGFDKTDISADYMGVCRKKLQESPYKSLCAYQSARQQIC